MNDNKLIAEFMGLSIKDGVSYYTDQDDMFFLGEVVFGPYIPFDEDWNWLIPVVDECFQKEGKHYMINDALLTINIDEVHQAVVKFIKEYNKQNN
jgi:hypothetical protein|tara:strand:- start:553 stop:837 length:285 start_codon:yes stop_codon:yes gene_type:complete